MTDPPNKLPEMREALLDGDGVAALFRDIRALTRVSDVVVRDRPGPGASHRSTTLDDAEQLLASRAVRAVQIRYDHDGASWFDTLTWTSDKVRLIRIQHPGATGDATAGDPPVP